MIINTKETLIENLDERVWYERKIKEASDEGNLTDFEAYSELLEILNRKTTNP